MHHLIHPIFIYNLYQPWGLDTNGPWISWAIEFKWLSFNWYLLVMIEHFSKWIELAPL
jgi:hypothetical protein